MTLDDADVPVAWGSAELVLGNYPAEPRCPALHLRPWELKVFRAGALRPWELQVLRRHRGADRQS